MKKRIQLLILLTIGLVKLGVAQNDVTISKFKYDATINDSICKDPQVIAVYSKGEDEMYKFIEKNIKYPEEAKERGLFGRVEVRFIVTKRGKLKNIVVVSTNSYFILNKEAIRVVKLFSKWIPAQYDGKPVNSYVTLPFIFNLTN